jgi:sugar-specific transcriptional regulator TrmB
LTGTNLKLLQSLIDIGLSEREAKTYLALLSKGSATASELQKISGIPRSKIYEVIDGLLRNGYCTEKRSGRNRTYEIIDPDVTLKDSYVKLHQRLEESYKFRDQLFDIYEESENGKEPLEYFESIHGNDSIHHRYCQLVHNTQSELLGFGRRPYACDTSEKSKEQDKESIGVIERGGIVRWVFEIELPEDEWVLKDLKNLKKEGQEIRIARKLPLKMMIFDREKILMAEEEPLFSGGELAMSVMKQRTIVNAFYALFEFFWMNSVDIDLWGNKNKIINKSEIKIRE